MRSVLEEPGDLTLVQFRALATLEDDHGAQRVSDLAAHLGVNSSTTTRMASRLLRKGLIIRTEDAADRRATRLEITAQGRAVVRAVTARRQAVISRIAQRIPAEHRDAMVEAMQTFTAAAGEGPEQDWTPGWTG